MSEVRYDVLGPLVVRRGGVELDLGSPLQQRLLAGLLLHPNGPVPMTDLLEAGWQYATPDDGPELTREIITALRDLLDPHRVPGTDGTLIQLSDGRYMLCAARDNVDLFVFEDLIASVPEIRARDHLLEASNRIRQALALWRGPLLEGHSGPLFDPVRARLEEGRLDVLDLYYEVELKRGSHHAILPGLAAHVARYPLRENLRATFLLTLYRTGRQFDAMQQYVEIRDRLWRLNGRQPSYELQELARRIAAWDQSLLREPG
ncbi:hypothetical protein GCM10009745_53600 [Kribbella yunnanensis]|uniref:OmpR/PhoB-type domain-containing protein n=1 Tax=Kribbella yunnanensis TaxID=190194 RepID=A0ABP4U7F1_9ACTN